MQTLARFCLSDKLVIFVSLLSLPLALSPPHGCSDLLDCSHSEGQGSGNRSNDNGLVWNGHVPSGYFIPHQQDSLVTTLHADYFLYRERALC